MRIMKRLALLALMTVLPTMVSSMPLTMDAVSKAPLIHEVADKEFQRVGQMGVFNDYVRRIYLKHVFGEIFGLRINSRWCEAFDIEPFYSSPAAFVDEIARRNWCGVGIFEAFDDRLVIRHFPVPDQPAFEEEVKAVLFDPTEERLMRYAMTDEQQRKYIEARGIDRPHGQIRQVVDRILMEDGYNDPKPERAYHSRRGDVFMMGQTIMTIRRFQAVGRKRIEFIVLRP